MGKRSQSCVNRRVEMTYTRTAHYNLCVMKKMFKHTVSEMLWTNDGKLFSNRGNATFMTSMPIFVTSITTFFFVWGSSLDCIEDSFSASSATVWKAMTTYSLSCETLKPTVRSRCGVLLRDILKEKRWMDREPVVQLRRTRYVQRRAFRSMYGLIQPPWLGHRVALTEDEVEVGRVDSLRNV